jgi:RND superfamily putative drug exporter
MVNAVAATGGVITSAGIVLAGVFAALGLLPLVTLGQLGLIVGIGVLVDTLVVRTLVVPALFSLVGDRMWWPGRLRRIATSHDEGDRDPQEGVPGDVSALREPVG